MRVGNALHDDGHYLFTAAERDAFLLDEPEAAKYFRPWIGSAEFINGFQRYCLWLSDANPAVNSAELRTMPEVLKRIEAVREFRDQSDTTSTHEKAETPREFYFKNIPTSAYVVVPKTSSIRRKYIPMGFQAPEYLPSDALRIVQNATLYHFGVLTSAAHMDWARRVCGRLKSDYRYSSGIVYNNFPWPKDPSTTQVRDVERCAQKLLDEREKLLGPKVSLADLYDPDTMPAELTRAHHDLDRAVDRCYRPRPFKNELSRIRFLFLLYLKYSPPANPLEGYDFEQAEDE
jgi:hypothetical protein